MLISSLLEQDYIMTILFAQYQCKLIQMRSSVKLQSHWFFFKESSSLLTVKPLCIVFLLWGNTAINAINWCQWLGFFNVIAALLSLSVSLVSCNWSSCRHQTVLVSHAQLSLFVVINNQEYLNTAHYRSHIVTRSSTVDKWQLVKARSVHDTTLIFPTIPTTFIVLH